MKNFFLLLIIIFLSNCSKPKTVLICGDHICVNKAEAEQYFKENLSIEVKIINKKVKDEINLVELNLKENQQGLRKVNLSSKKETKKELKVLSRKEIGIIKDNIKKKQKKRVVNKSVANKNKLKKIVKKQSNKLDDHNKHSLKADYYKNYLKEKSRSLLKKVNRIKNNGKKNSS